MIKFLLDTYAWVEYLEGSTLGERVREILANNDNEIFSSSITLAETISKAIRSDKDPDAASAAITSLSRVVPVDSPLTKLAGKLHAERKSKVKDFGMIDAIILATARNLNLTIVTGDPHFSKEESVEFLR